MSETGDAGLIYKEYDNNALQPAPQPDAAPEISDEIIECIVDAVLDLEERVANRFAAERRYANQELETGLMMDRRRIGEISGELAELRGLVSELLTQLGQKKAADAVDGTVVDLPRDFWRRDRA